MFLIELGTKFPNIKKYEQDDKCIITIQFGLFTIKWLNKPLSVLLTSIELENIEHIAKNDLIINNMQQDFDNLVMKNNEETRRLMKCINDLQDMVHTLSLSSSKKDKKIKA